MLKVYVYPGDSWGCGSYRLRWPAMGVSALREAGMDVTITNPGSRSLAVEFDRQTGVAFREHFPADADVVVLQRLTNHYVAQVPRLLAARGVACVVDMDDDLSCIHPRNPAHVALAPFQNHPVAGRIRNVHSHADAAQACRDATLVTVTTPALAKRYGAHGRVRVLPNCVPQWYLDVPHADSERVGWAGSVHSHPDDLPQVGPAVAKLQRTMGLEFSTVGNPKGVARALGLREDPPSPGDVELAAWPYHLAELGIGVAPLAPTVFNDAKSWLKPLEYAAVGVPALVSPAADYRRWAELGAAEVVEKQREWERRIRSLVGDAGRRRDRSEKGREVARAFTIEANAWRWAEAWAYAAQLARTKVPAGAA